MNAANPLENATDGWYTAADQPELAEFGPVSGLCVTGRGAPGGPEYQQCVRALYGVAAATGRPPAALEGRWWVEDDRPPLTVPREEWHWHLFLRLPAGFPPQDADRAREAARPSGATVDRVQFVTFTEGSCVQMTHHGSFADEAASLARMGEFMAANGLVHAGTHHEIYLTDPVRTPQDALRTILRQPVRRVA
ncbi:GyrI-like domain-containing protein [Spongiactinospora sp. TRM90649]|uniref:GyrI-like domain-containing protein n=1 Tax=Spongiactinospora sp. TRM90649 TaxID=3031114 RepID=UPI0023F90EC3|nr:GyrI-like domain-containing protein [Spongiactinospora sp. TRM90649]MDF5756705.1 GyrI-like domain-containing protein [Spongiactinospora sp. TRM90649]